MSAFDWLFVVGIYIVGVITGSTLRGVVQDLRERRDGAG